MPSLVQVQPTIAVFRDNNRIVGTRLAVLSLPLHSLSVIRNVVGILVAELSFTHAALGLIIEAVDETGNLTTVHME